MHPERVDEVGVDLPPHSLAHAQSQLCKHPGAKVEHQVILRLE